MRLILLLLLIQHAVHGAPMEQVAGHKGSFTPLSEEVILKRTTRAEREFYQKLDPRSPLAQLVPRPLEVSDEGVLMENLLAPFKQPCVLDLKMGTRTWCRDTPAEKISRAQQSDRRSTTATLGIRIAGMRCGARQLSKAEAKLLTPEEVQEALSTFFSHTSHPYQELLAPIQQWFAENRRLRFTASSLLFIHEGAEIENRHPPIVRMIDFAHVEEILAHEQEERDQRYLFGLNTLSRMIHLTEKESAE